MVGIGDSIVKGNYAPNTDFVDLLCARAGWSCLNSGVNGNLTDQILARLNADAISHSPDYILLEGGVNDASYSVPAATIIANWESMIDAVISAGDKPIAMSILPSNNITNTMSQIVDSANVGISAKAIASGAISADCRTTMSQFRIGGDPGNLWDLKPAYTSDGTHLSTAGAAALAACVYGAIYP